MPRKLQPNGAMLALVLVLAACWPAQATAATVTVSGTDRRAIAKAVESACKGREAGGAVVFRSGTYFVGQPIRILSGCKLSAQRAGQVILQASQNQIFSIEGDGVSIDGLILDGGWIAFGRGDTYSRFTLTNSTIKNLWSGGTNGGPAALSGTTLSNSTISNNTFLNLWGGGSPGYPNSPPVCTNTCDGTGIDSWGSAGISFYGLDQTTISNNTFNQIASDGMHLVWEAWTGHINARASSGNVIAYNTFTKVRRIPIEIQTVASNCPGGCDYSLTPTAGLQVKGNYIHDYAFPYYDTWGSSIVPDGAVNSLYINNTFLAEPGDRSGYASCMESSGRDSLSQGNVCASVAGGRIFFKAGISQGGGSHPRYKSIYQNSIFCGHPATLRFEQEPSDPNPNASTMIEQYNYKNGNACPAGKDLSVSDINAAFTSPDHQSFGPAASALWSVSVVSNLSIRYVQFFVDGSTTPMATQEIQDVNQNFAKDRKWLYHASFATAGLSGGAHRVAAVATDVSGTQQTISQTFAIGG